MFSGCLRCSNRQLIVSRGKKTNVQKPRPKPWKVRVMASITRPIYFEDPVPISDRCERVHAACVVQVSKKLCTFVL